MRFEEATIEGSAGGGMVKATEATEVDTTGDPAEALLLHLLRAAQAVADGGEHEVLEHLDVFGVDDLRRDRDRR